MTDLVVDARVLPSGGASAGAIRIPPEHVRVIGSDASGVDAACASPVPCAVPTPLALACVPRRSQLLAFVGRWVCVHEVNRRELLDAVHLNFVLKGLMRMAKHLSPPPLTLKLEEGDVLVNYVSLLGYNMREEYRPHVYFLTTYGVTARVSVWWEGLVLHTHSQSCPPLTAQSRNRRYLDADGCLHVDFAYQKDVDSAVIEYKRTYRRSR